MIEKAKQVKKSITAALGIVALLLSAGVLPDPADKIAAGILAVGTVFGVWKATNEPTPVVPDPAPQ